MPSKPHRLAILLDHRGHRLDPALLLVSLRREPVVRLIRLAVAQALLDRGHDLGLILGVDVLLEAENVPLEAAAAMPWIFADCPTMSRHSI